MKYYIEYDITNDVTIKANNTTISAANINATNTLIADIGNNLTIESLQDTYYSKSNSQDANLSIGSSGVGGGFNLGKDNTDSALVNNQTTLTADNSIDIKVGTREEQSYINQEGNKVITQTSGQGKTTITGAVIASGQYTTDKDGNTTFKDNGNLSLTTKELAYNDLNDFSTSNSKGFGLQTNSSTSTLTLKSIGEEQAQDTKATIGNGTIIIGEQEQTELAGLNRDASNSQKITKDQITGALDGNMSVDNRIFTDNGRESIVNDFKNLPQNTKEAFNNVYDVAKSGVELVNNVIEKVRQGIATKEEVEQAKQIYTMSASVYAMAEGKLNDPNSTPKEIAQAESIIREMQKLSKDGEKLLKTLEGYSSTPYKDIAGITTIANGIVISEAEAEKYKNGISKQEAELLLQTKIDYFEKGVNEQITTPLKQNEFDALVILAFNIGLGKKYDKDGKSGLYESSVREIINNPTSPDTTYQSLDSAWKAWRNAGNNKGALDSRRDAELKVYNSGDYSGYKK
ncbi:MAG: hypothetical protein Ta2D_10690 [Rickettsiales bacterium]|nr:MAG: hypothetical protein Ta2D_10690 [Rickettsiales bacterium]